MRGLVWIVWMVLLCGVVSASLPNDLAHIFAYNDSAGIQTQTIDLVTSVAYPFNDSTHITESVGVTNTSQLNHSLFLPYNLSRPFLNLSYAYFNGTRLNSTWETWWRTATAAGVNKGIISQRRGDAGVVLFWNDAESRFECFWQQQPGMPSVDQVNSSVYTLSNASWYHLACVLNENWMTLVVNGTNVSHVDFAGPRSDNDYDLTAGGGAYLQVGRYPESAAIPDAYFAHTRIWNVSRTAANISAHMNDVFQVSASSEGGYLQPYDVENHKHYIYRTGGSQNSSWGNFHPYGNMLHATKNENAQAGGLLNRWADGGCIALYYAENNASFGSSSPCTTEGTGADYSWGVVNKTWYPHKVVGIFDDNNVDDRVYETITGDSDVIAINLNLSSKMNTSAYAHNLTFSFTAGVQNNLTDFGNKHWTGFNVTWNQSNTEEVSSTRMVTYFVLFSLNASNLNDTGTGTFGRAEWTLTMPSNLTIVFVENSTFYANQTRVDAWLQNFSESLEEVRTVYNEYAQGFKYPVNISASNESIDRYYEAIWEYGTLQFKVPRNQRNMTNFRNPDGSANYSLHMIVPNPRNYLGQWIWDTASADFGVLAAINYSSPTSWRALSYVEDHLTIWLASQNSSQETQNHGPEANFRWYQHLTFNVTTENATQPMGMNEITNFYLNYVLKGNHSQLCTMYPVLKAHYVNMSETLTEDDMELCAFGNSGDAGRDASSYSGAEYWPSCTAFMQSSAYYLNKTAAICGDATTDYSADWIARKQNITNLMWKDDLRIGDGTKYAGYAPLSAAFAPYTTSGIGYELTGDMGLFLWTPVPTAANASAVYTTLSGDLFTHNGTGATTNNWPTSLSTNATTYDPNTQWNGPIWTFDILHDGMGFLHYGMDAAYLALQERMDWYSSHDPMQSESYDAASGYANSSWSKRPYTAGVGALLYMFSSTDILTDTFNLSEVEEGGVTLTFANWTNVTTNNSIALQWHHNVGVNVSVLFGADQNSLTNRTNWTAETNVTWNYTYEGLSEGTQYYVNATICTNATGCTIKNLVYTTSANTLEYPAYALLGHPRLFGGEALAVTLATNLNASVTSLNWLWRDWTLIARSTDNTTCSAGWGGMGGNPPGRAAQLWHTSLYAYIYNDQQSMRWARECMDWWFVNATKTFYNNLGAHDRGRIYHTLGLSLDVLWNNLTTETQNRYIDGLMSNVSSIEGIMNDTADVNFANATQLDRENGRFIRSGLLTLCYVTLGHANATAEQKCGDDEKNWSLSNWYGVKSFRNASFWVAPDGHFDYYTYGQKSSVGNWILHDRMADMGFNFTRYNTTFGPTFSQSVNNWYYPVIHTKYDGNETWDGEELGNARHITIGDANIYSGMHPDMLMAANMWGWSSGRPTSIAWWLLNVSSTNQTEYDMYNSSVGHTNNRENRYLEEFYLYNPAQVNITPPWSQGHVNTTQYALEGLAVYKGTTADNPSNPQHLYFAHLSMDQSGGHPNANANDIFLDYNGETCLMSLGESYTADIYRNDGWFNGLVLNNTFGRRSGAWGDGGQEEPGRGYQRYGLYVSGTSIGTYSQVIMDAQRDNTYPNVSWANTTQRSLPDAYHGSAYGEAMTLTGLANYYTIRPGWQRTSIVFEGDIVALADHIWNTQTTSTNYQFLYHTPGIWTVTDSIDSTQVSAYTQVNDTRCLMSWGGFTGTNMSLTAWPRNETVYGGRDGVNDAFSNNLSVLWALANNGTIAQNWTHLNIVAPYNNSRDPQPNISFGNESSQKVALINHSHGTYIVTVPVNRAEALSNTLNVSHGNFGNLVTTAYALTTKSNNTNLLSLYVVNTTSLTWNSTALIQSTSGPADFSTHPMRAVWWSASTQYPDATNLTLLRDRDINTIYYYLSGSTNFASLNASIALAHTYFIRVYGVVISDPAVVNQSNAVIRGSVINRIVNTSIDGFVTDIETHVINSTYPAYPGFNSSDDNMRYYLGREINISCLLAEIATNYSIPFYSAIPYSYQNRTAYQSTFDAEFDGGIDNWCGDGVIPMIYASTNASTISILSDIVRPINITLITGLNILNTSSDPDLNASEYLKATTTIMQLSQSQTNLSGYAAFKMTALVQFNESYADVATGKFTAYLNLSNQSRIMGSLRSYTALTRINLSYSFAGTDAIVNRFLLDGAQTTSRQNSTSDQTFSFLSYPDDDHAFTLELNQSVNATILAGGSGSGTTNLCGADLESSVGRMFLRFTQNVGTALSIFGALLGAVVVLWALYFREHAFPWPVILAMLIVFFVIFLIASTGAWIVGSMC